MPTIICGKARDVTFGPGFTTVVIGERINPTGRKKLAQSLCNGSFDVLIEEAVRQKDAGADIIDINVGMSGIVESNLLVRAINAVTDYTGLPICVDSANPEAIAAALEACTHKPLINSVTGEEASLRTILPLIRKYGAAVVGMPVDERGIPKTASERIEIATKIVHRAEVYGIPPEDVVIDCLAIAASADMSAANAAIQTVRAVTKHLGLASIMGISNISFGLPQRKVINSTFLAIAIEAGLSAAIVDPTDNVLMYSLLSANLLIGRDEYAANFLSYYRARA